MATKRPPTLAHLYDEAGLSRRQVAHRAGCTAPELHAIETGRELPTDALVGALRDVLGKIPLSWQTIDPDGIRARRLALGLTMREVCNEIGYSDAHLSAWERGKDAPPSAAVLDALARVYECSVRDLAKPVRVQVR